MTPRARGMRGLGLLALVLLFGCGEDPSAIRNVQGDGHRSPLVDQPVEVDGVVTAVLKDGFFLQSERGRPPAWSRREQRSDGIRVLLGDHQLERGDRVRVRAVVREHAGRDNELTVTMLEPEPGVEGTEAITLVERGVELPDAMDLPQVAVDAGGTADRWEAVEGMLVTVDGASVVGASNGFGELAILPDQAAEGLLRTSAGGVVATDDAADLAVILLDDVLVQLPQLATGARIDRAFEAIVDYRYGSYRLYPTEPISATPAPDRETASVGPPGRLRAATLNVENLDLGDGLLRFRSLARLIVEGLGAPDVLALQEVQDDSGSIDDGVVSSERTHRQLIEAISAVGGPHYAFREVRPLDNRDGGQPGANIRTSVLARVGAGLRFVDRTAPGAKVAPRFERREDRTVLLPSPAAIGVDDEAFVGARKPLIVELEHEARPLWIVNVHLSSKRPDDPTLGLYQPPRRPSAEQRAQQARAVANLVESLLALDPTAQLLILGDFNDDLSSRAIEVLESAGMVDLVRRLPPAERYTYVYRGLAQPLDHILASPSLAAEDPVVAAIHVHADQPTEGRLSDHDPVVVTFAAAPQDTETAAAGSSGSAP